jgi:hypothetical protein
VRQQARVSCLINVGRQEFDRQIVRVVPRSDSSCGTDGILLGPADPVRAPRTRKLERKRSWRAQGPGLRRR